MSNGRFGNDYYPRPDTGRPVANGKLFFGIVDTDPEVNPIHVYATLEDSTVVEIPQPVYLSSGGVPVYGNSYIKLTVLSDYSLKVKDANDVSLYYFPNMILSDNSPGPQGFQGNQGFQGLQGNQGYQGSPGCQGPQGVTGNQGAQGDIGSQGYQGHQGIQGYQGAQGNQGNQGFQGTDGIQGAQGVTGAQGNQGNQGYQGDIGPQGYQGSQGATGPQGVDGLSIVWLGTYAGGTTYDQGDGTSFNGSLYVSLVGSNTGNQPDTSPSQWEVFAGAQGPQGVQGSSGAQGPQGNVGSQGATGNQGVQGATGPQGVQGNVGSQGATGNQGVQGYQGATGAQGLIGPQGNIGSQGARGSQGYQGSQGSQGPQGNIGATLVDNILVGTGGLIKIGTGTKDSNLNGIVLDNTEIVGQVNGVDSFYLRADGTGYFTEIITHNYKGITGMVAGNIEIIDANARRDTTSTVPLLRKSFRIGISGTYRIRWNHGAWDSTDFGGYYYTYSRVYKNGSAFGAIRSFSAPYDPYGVGTYLMLAEDLSFNAGDTCEIWAWSGYATVTTVIKDAAICVGSTPLQTIVVTN